MSSSQHPRPAHDVGTLARGVHAPGESTESGGAPARRIQCAPPREPRDFAHAPRGGRPRRSSAASPHATRSLDDAAD